MSSIRRLDDAMYANVIAEISRIDLSIYLLCEAFPRYLAMFLSAKIIHFQFYPSRKFASGPTEIGQYYQIGIESQVVPT